MKIRTDFVTNSSSSSFLVFDVHHPKLFDLLTGLGIKINNTDKGHFTDGMEIVLPDGEEMNFYEIEPDYMPAYDEASSISSWVLNLILCEIESLYPAKEIDDYTDFTISLLKLLNENGIINFDMDNVESWDRELLFEQLVKLDDMDKDVVEADAEFNTGFEGEILHMEYFSAKNGCSLLITLNEDGDEIERNLNGLKVAFVGDDTEFGKKDKILELIRNANAIIVENIEKDTDFVICNHVGKYKSLIQKTKDFCIPTISERGFINRFGSMEDFDGGDDLHDELFECTYEGDFYDMFYEYGIGNVFRKY